MADIAKLADIAKQARGPNGIWAGAIGRSFKDIDVKIAAAQRQAAIDEAAPKFTPKSMEKDMANWQQYWNHVIMKDRRMR